VLHLRLTTSWGSLRLSGGSRAGEGTLLLLPQLRLALDAGRPARALVPMQHVVVSHGHLDHLLGLPAWASQRHLQGIRGGTVWAPATISDEVRRLVALAAHLEGGKPYDVEIRAVAPGDVVPLRRDFELVFFAASHWVDTLGCCLRWVNHHLRPELAQLPPEELRNLRRSGESVAEEVRVPLLAYLSDTGPGVFDSQPWVADCEVIITECTFLAPGERERAVRFGHTHLDDLVKVAPRLNSRHLVVTHLSRRHRLAAGERLIRETLAPAFGGRLHLLNVEWE
jgi:ribonuclease Z